MMLTIPILLKMSFISVPEVSPGNSGMARQINAGTGFAVTTINF